MEHPELGYHFGLPVEVPSLSAEPIEIVLAPDRTIELQLLDDAEPLPSLSCLPIEEHRFSRLPMASSDAAGLVRWMAVGAGRFRVQIRQPGYWPTDAEVEALPPGQRTEVQVRRLGDLDVTVTRVAGGSTAGVALELESLEFGVPVATWLADARVTSSTGSLTKDRQGRLSLTGLPRGKYGWSAEGAGGTVEVSSDRREQLTALLP